MKILMVGLGAIGQRHARNLRQLLGPDAELIACRQRGLDVCLSERMEIRAGVTPEESLNIVTYRDLDQALTTRPQAVIVANPSSMHLVTARKVVEAGCALFLEKPVSHTWDGVPDLARLIVDHHTISLVGYQWRFHPLLLQAKKILDHKMLGRLVAVNAVCGEYLPSWHPYEDYRRSYAARRDLGGGVLLTQIHDFDYLGWMVGWPDRVFAVGGHLSDLEMDVEDTCSTLLTCCVDGRPIPIHVHQDYLQKPPVRTCDFIGERGRMHIDLLRGRLDCWGADGRNFCNEDFSTFVRNEMFLSEMRHFLACVAGTERSQIPVAEGTKSLAIALAAHRSLCSAKPENIEY